MKNVKALLLGGCVLALAAGSVFAGINSKEVGAVLFYPEYSAYNFRTSQPQHTYITVTNNKAAAVNAHVEVVDKHTCSDCNFDLPLTGFQTKRLRISLLNPIPAGVLSPNDQYHVVIEDASGASTDPGPLPILGACNGPTGFVVVSLEAVDANGVPVEPRRTIGDNMLHGDEVVIDLTFGDAVQVGAIAVQGVGPNDGNRVLRFDNVEYAAFPSIVTGDYWASRPNIVDPYLVLFNANIRTGDPNRPVTSCLINFVDAEEHRFSASYNFGCWTKVRLDNINPSTLETVLGTANGYLWAQCEAGTHGAMWTELGNSLPGPYPHEGGEFKDTLFQSVTTNPAAVMTLTADITGDPNAPGDPNGGGDPF